MQDTELKNQFDLLPTFKKKYSFWERTLKMDYIEFLNNFNDLSDYHKFEIEVEQSQWSDYNIFLLEKFKSKNLEDYKILDLTELQKNFIAELKTKTNKVQFIKEKIKEIDESFRDVGSLLGNRSVSVKINHKFNAFYKSYLDMLNYDLEPDWSFHRPGLNTVKVENGKILAKYRKFLVKKLSNKENSKKTPQEESLSALQMALIFNYSGALDGMACDHAIKARILTPFFNRTYKSVYDNIRTAKNTQKKDDLEKVAEFFKKNNAPEFLKKVQKDILKAI